jgi:hypothetical protein
MDDNVFIPKPHFKKQPRTSTDCPRPVLSIKYFGKPTISFHQPKNLIYLSNEEKFTIEPLQYKILTFHTIVFTSINARSLVYAEDLLHRHGLTFTVNNMPTNDTFLFIEIFNTLSVSKTFEKDSLQFNCLTLLANA